MRHLRHFHACARNAPPPGKLDSLQRWNRRRTYRPRQRPAASVGRLPTGIVIKTASFAKRGTAPSRKQSTRSRLEARRRAVEGVERIVYHKGVECGRVREYSDTLLMFLLRSHRPQKYRDNTKVQTEACVKAYAITNSPDDL